jgi:hypothetical protein
MQPSGYSRVEERLRRFGAHLEPATVRRDQAVPQNELYVKREDRLRRFQQESILAKETPPIPSSLVEKSSVVPDLREEEVLLFPYQSFR